MLLPTRPQEIAESPLRLNPCEGWGLFEALVLLLGGLSWLFFGVGRLPVPDWVDWLVLPITVGSGAAWVSACTRSLLCARAERMS